MLKMNIEDRIERWAESVPVLAKPAVKNVLLTALVVLHVDFGIGLLLFGCISAVEGSVCGARGCAGLWHVAVDYILWIGFVCLQTSEEKVCRMLWVSMPFECD